MAKVIVITSGKGGVGKTTSTINLGAAFNHFGHDVLILDANISTPNVGIHLGSPEVPININHVLNQRAEIEEAIYEHNSGMKIIPASLSINELKKTRPEKLKDIKKDFDEISQIVLVDSAAGLGNEAQSAIEMADEIIIITNPEMPAITDALKAIKFAEQKKKKVLGVIITRVRKDRVEMSPEVVKEMLEIPILGMIPEDRTITKSLNLRGPVVLTHPKSKPARAYKEIAARIINHPYDSEEDKESVLEIIFRKLKRK